MAKTYEAVMDAVAVTAQKTLVELATADDTTIEILRVEMCQETLVTDELWSACIQTYSATGTGTAFTAMKYLSKDPAAATTAKTNMTVEGAGAAKIKVFAPFHVKNGLVWVPTPEERIMVVGSAFVGLKLIKTPSASATVTALIVFREF